MSKIKKLKVKISDTDFGEPIPLGADATNVDMSTGESVEEAMLNRVEQEFDNTAQGDASLINADTVQGEGLVHLYSDFIVISVPASSAQPNQEDMYYADVTVSGMTPQKAILGIQMSYDTSIDTQKAKAAYSWDYLETGTNKISFYGTSSWVDSFTIIGVVVQAEEGEY